MLLGLTLSAQAFAAGTKTIHNLYEGCKERVDVMAPNPTRSQLSWLNAGSTEGYITGYAEAMLMDHDLQLPETNGELHEAVCKYIELHPEIWNMPSFKGMPIVLNALYASKK